MWGIYTMLIILYIELYPPQTRKRRRQGPVVYDEIVVESSLQETPPDENEEGLSFTENDEGGEDEEMDDFDEMQVK